MLIDSHCHLNLLDFTESVPDLDSAIKECDNAKIEHMLCVAIDLNGFDEIAKIADNYDNISISAGVHPNEMNVNLNTLKDQLNKQAIHPKVIAIGETGLDYYRTEDDLEEQQEKFSIHIDLAKELDKPLIIHTRNAPEDTIIILKQNNARDTSGVMHCFTESYDVAKKALDLGFYISLSGIVTFKNAHQIHEVAKKVPLDRLLVETDCPYLSPVPYRGKPNFPHHVKHVAEYIANLRGISFDELADATTQNFYQLFKVKK